MRIPPLQALTRVRVRPDPEPVLRAAPGADNLNLSFLCRIIISLSVPSS